jgi:hypothetical protein
MQNIEQALVIMVSKNVQIARVEKITRTAKGAFTKAKYQLTLTGAGVDHPVKRVNYRARREAKLAELGLTLVATRKPKGGDVVVEIMKAA